MIDLVPQELDVVQRILRQVVPGRTVWAYGSRVNGRRRKWSDLDLAIVGDTPLSFREMTKLEWEFEQSDLPFRVDVTDLASASPAFRERIERAHEVLLDAAASTPTREGASQGPG